MKEWGGKMLESVKVLKYDKKAWSVIQLRLLLI